MHNEAEVNRFGLLQFSQLLATIVLVVHWPNFIAFVFAGNRAMMVAPSSSVPTSSGTTCPTATVILEPNSTSSPIQVVGAGTSTTSPTVVVGAATSPSNPPPQTEGASTIVVAPIVGGARRTQVGTCRWSSVQLQVLIGLKR